MSEAPIIRLKGASFGYADREVISNVDLTVGRGDVVAVLGPNGSGKSTLVKGLLGLDDHLGGEVDLFGTPRSRFTEHTRLGYVPQRHSLSASVRATAAEIVAVGRTVARPWWRPASRADHAIVQQCLDIVGLGDRAHEDVSTFSGGQQRRVLIARALAARPDVLIMDEPTAGVDLANQRALADVLRRLVDQGATMVIVTHELDALADVVTRILCISNGRVDFDGSSAAYASHSAAHQHGDGHHHDDESPPSDRHPAPTHEAGVTGPLDSDAGRRMVPRA